MVLSLCLNATNGRLHTASAANGHDSDITTKQRVVIEHKCT